MAGQVKSIDNLLASGGTAEQLTTTSIKVLWAILQCSAGTEIFIGDSNVTVTTAGFSIAVGDPPLTIPPHRTDPPQLFDLNQIWFDGTTNDVIRCIYLEDAG